MFSKWASLPTLLLSGVTITVLLMTPLFASMPTLKIACSSNFVSTLEKIASLYQKQHDIKIIIMQGSSGKLTSQLVNGLPADIFLSADKKHTQYLIQQKIADKYFIYAIGQVVLLTNSTKKYDSAKDYLEHENIIHLSLANPELAPYGAHGKKLLQDMKLWNSLSSKIIYGENINQAFNYVISGNVTAGFVASSQISQYKLRHGSLKATQHVYNFSDSISQISQYGTILKHTKQSKVTKDFVHYLLNSKQSQKILKKMGYKTTTT